MSEPYVLKKAENFSVVQELNDVVRNGYEGIAINRAMGAWTQENPGQGFPKLDQIEDWITALKSGKKIINPMSPREELKHYYESECGYVQYGVNKAIEIIAKEHPDVANWLKDGDADV